MIASYNLPCILVLGLAYEERIPQESAHDRLTDDPSHLDSLTSNPRTAQLKSNSTRICTDHKRRPHRAVEE